MKAINVIYGTYTHANESKLHLIHLYLIKFFKLHALLQTDFFGNLSVTVLLIVLKAMMRQGVFWIWLISLHYYGPILAVGTVKC